MSLFLYKYKNIKMKQLTYNNINCKFTFELVCSKLVQFWIEEVIILNKNNHKNINQKIWLTISIVNQNNRTFTLIKNLPFNVSDMTDITVVLRQKFESKILYYRKEKVDNIRFEYRLENKRKDKIDYKLVFTNIILALIVVFASISLTIIILNLYFEISQVVNFDYVNDQSLNWENRVLKIKETNNTKIKKYCVFDPFIKLFDSGGSFKHVPSKFLESNLKVDSKDFNLLEYIFYNQYVILDYNVSDKIQLIRDLNGILQGYQYMTGINLG